MQGHAERVQHAQNNQLAIYARCVGRPVGHLIVKRHYGHRGDSAINRGIRANSPSESAPVKTAKLVNWAHADNRVDNDADAQTFLAKCQKASGQPHITTIWHDNGRPLGEQG